MCLAAVLRAEGPPQSLCDSQRELKALRASGRSHLWAGLTDEGAVLRGAAGCCVPGFTSLFRASSDLREPKVSSPDLSGFPEKTPPVFCEQVEEEAGVSQQPVDIHLDFQDSPSGLAALPLIPLGVERLSPREHLRRGT